jgi:hypothetical protein
VICCTLLGVISLHQLSSDPLELKLVFSKNTESFEKVNAMAVAADWLAVGGFGKDKKGAVELWGIKIGNDDTQACLETPK